MQQFCRARGGRWKARSLVVEHVAREPDRGERRAQLVRHIAHEALLELTERGEPSNLLLQARGHPVERPSEGRNNVFASLGNSRFKLTSREPLTRRRRHAHRANNEAHHAVGDRADQHDERESAEQQGLLHESERLFCVTEVVDEVELVPVSVGYQ